MVWRQTCLPQCQRWSASCKSFDSPRAECAKGAFKVPFVFVAVSAGCDCVRGSLDDNFLALKATDVVFCWQPSGIGIRRFVRTLRLETESSLLERSKLVPELIVRNLNDSLQFWVDTLGFCVAYARPHEKFVYLSLGSAQLMLEELGVTTGQWLTASLEQPFGRGINFQIEVDTVAPILERLHCAGYALFRDCQDLLVCCRCC